jgi:16S rRNA (uracil1498-N3)-methyltransferase
MMRLHRFYLSEKIENKKIKITDEKLVHQWRNVFRYNVGSEVVLFDGSGLEWSAVIEKMGNREIEVRVASERKAIMPKEENKREITLCISLIKKDNLEWVIEKATELGVSKIVPVISERSEKKGFNIERARKIAVEASEQCGRGDVPVLESSKHLVDSIEEFGKNAIVFDPSGSHFDSLLLTANYNLLSIFIGPEGGWSEKELEIFKQKGAKIYSLGKLILRAETAAVAGLAKIL